MYANIIPIIHCAKKCGKIASATPPGSSNLFIFNDRISSNKLGPSCIRLIADTLLQYDKNINPIDIMYM